MPINTPYVGYQTASLQRVLYLQAGSGITLTPDLVNGNLTIGATGGLTGAPLTEVNDTNVTLALGGTPATALLQAVSLTLGWTGQLAVGRGGTGTGTAFTAGSVVFAGASGVYAQDNANFFWADGNARLTLGGGGAAIQAGLIINGGTNTNIGPALLLQRGGISISALAASSELLGGTSSDTILYAFAGNALQFYTNAVKALVLDTSQNANFQGGALFPVSIGSPGDGSIFFNSSSGLCIQAKTGSSTDFDLFSVGAGTSALFMFTGTANLGMNALLRRYNGVATVGGVGIAVVYGAAVLTGQTANATVCTYTPASDGTFFVNANARIISGGITGNVVVDWTDAYSGAAQTNGIFVGLGNAASFGGSVSIRAKGGTTITIHTITSGSGTYDVDGQIVQYA